MRRDRYPDGLDRQHKRARAKFEEILHSLPDLGYENRGVIKAVWRHDYGNVNLAWIGANKLVDDASETEWLHVRSRLYDLCYGGGDLVTRFEAVMSIKGFGPVVPTKLLSIIQPERFLPNFTVRPKNKNSEYPGKLEMIDLLDRCGLFDASTADEVQALLEVPRSSVNNGDMVVRSNDMLLELLRPYFSPDDVVDTWGMAQFLYWLAKRG